MITKDLATARSPRLVRVRFRWERKALFVILLAGVAAGVALVTGAWRGLPGITPDDRLAPRVVTVRQPGHEPGRLAIPALSVDAPVVRLGLEADGSLQTPAGMKEVGWFAGGAAPGDTGAAILVGHLDSAFGRAVFWRLRDLKAGAELVVTRTDGSTVKFKVSRTAAYRYDNFPSSEVYGATPRPSLRLLTCAGTYDRRTGHYSENLVVYADLSDE